MLHMYGLVLCSALKC